MAGFGAGLMGFVGILALTIAGIVAFSVVGFLMGVISAFVFNLVVKLSGGLSFDAELT